MKHIEGSFKGVRNSGIHYQAWLPEGEVKAVLLVVHGLGEHSGRYMNVVNHFVPLGYAVYGCDHIGHGKSAGARAFIERFEDYADTLTMYYRMVEDWQKGKPVFLLGHSMGGLIAADYLIDHQAGFRGAILSAPSIKASIRVSPPAVAMARLLSLLTPRLGLLALNANDISRDPAVVAAYVNDPLVFRGKVPARLGTELWKAMDRVAAEGHKIALPLIILQGSEDKLVDPAGAQMLYDQACSTDKTLKFYEGLYHEVFNEPERGRVLKDVETWLAAFP